MATADPANRPPSDTNRVMFTLFLAAALHGILILGVVFNPEPEPSRTVDTLDVALVSRASDTPPEEARFIARQSQAGGGPDNAERPPRPGGEAPGVERTAQTDNRRPAAPAGGERGAATVLTTAEAEQRAPSADGSAGNGAGDTTRQRPSPQELAERSFEIARLTADIRVFSRPPETLYLTAATREAAEADYLRRWVNRVERIGNLNYPDAARRQRLSGRLILEAVLDREGGVRDVRVLRSSGHAILDDAAQRIVMLGAPYPAFPDRLRREAEELHIIRTWDFRSGRTTVGALPED